MNLSEITYPLDTKDRVQNLLVEEATRTSTPVPMPDEPELSKPRPLVRRTVLLAAAATVLAGALVATDAIDLLWRSPATAEAVEALDSAATQTLKASDPAMRPDQFLQVDITAVYTDHGIGGAGSLYWLESQNRQMYVPADGRGPWTINFEESRPVAYFGEATEAAVLELEARTPRSRSERGDLRQVEAPLSTEELAALPLEPQKLLETIRGKGNSDDVQAFGWISDLLRTGVLSAKLRAALYRAAALIPGVSIADRQATLNGSEGIAVGMVDNRDNTRREMILDRETGQFIGERVVDLDGYDAVPPGTTTAWTAVTTSVVDTAPLPSK